MSIRLMNDYGNEFPLWGDEGALNPSDRPLPSVLAARLYAWAGGFNQHYHEETGWPSAEMEREHRAEGQRLLAELRAALPNDAITLDYWEERHQ